MFKIIYRLVLQNDFASHSDSRQYKLVFLAFKCASGKSLDLLILISMFFQFLAELARMFYGARNAGTVRMTIKRCKLCFV